MLKPAWEPVPGINGLPSSQYFGYTVKADEILLYGTRAYGKTATQLMRFRKNVGVGYNSYWKGAIIDVEYSSFKDIISQSKRFFPRVGRRPKFLESAHLLKWVWPTGEELLFVYAKDEKDYERKLHGMEFPFIGFNEVTKHYCDDLYKLSFSIRRSGFAPLEHTTPKLTEQGSVLYDQHGEIIYDTPNGKVAPHIPLETFSTCNPWGSGALWVQRRFIDGYTPGKIYRDQVEVEGDIIDLSRVAIGGSWKENLRKNGGFIDSAYIARMKEECKGNRNRYMAWIKGQWGYAAGGMFDALWDKNIHILQPFKIPSGWRVDRGFDWGSSHPFYVGWFAESDGTAAVAADGSVFCPPKGTIILIYEWYGTDKIGTNEAMKNHLGDSLTPDEIADGIISREVLIRASLLHPGAQIFAGPADNQINNNYISNIPSIAKLMALKGIRWTESDKTPNSRVNGWSLIRQLLANGHPNEQGTFSDQPRFYCFANCKGFISTFPILQMDKKKIDDVDTKSEDHPADVLRYRVLASKHIVKSDNVIGFH